jgi:hemoglobin
LFESDLSPFVSQENVAAGGITQTGDTAEGRGGPSQAVLFLREKLWHIGRSMNLTGESLYDRMGGRDTLALLLRHFYADIRQHKLVGPIFNEHIQDWPTHLEIIGSFWARLTGGPSAYSGQMPAKHLNLGLNASHFQAWLQLWEFNCRKYLKMVEAQEMISLAREIGRRLKGILGVSDNQT